ncbi:hypothetical protein KUH03_10395 [Sphingobacterium sp. E70]|uniref:hypothetical protein n=1 Tax=Sphingobacterium sp. E70 TaxID=2853439 RepID=UPI00211BE67D|nr:hypothetical protein [Sphingobacterium sp. E70]ULT27138.1 hypothetical protein KUH03_10395 [Sphingobacterium sp. E70]
MFDLDKIIEVSTGDDTSEKCGKDANGNLYAFNYRYILPQIGYQKINNASPFSTIQVNDEGTQFWTGQYYAGSADAAIVPQVFGFPIDADGKLQNSGIVTVTPKTVYLLITMPMESKVYSEKETGHGYPAQDLRAIPTDPMQDWHATAMAQITPSVTDGPMVPNPYIMKQLMVISGV